jgi:hypothetical protein
MLLSSERDTTEVGDQWFFVLAAINRDFEAFHGPVGGMPWGVATIDLKTSECGHHTLFLSLHPPTWRREQS